MPKLHQIDPLFVDEVPEVLDNGTLYICLPCRVVMHNCCCGCGEEVSSPLGVTEYKLVCEGAAVSLWPSIGNHDYPCGSHYWIERNGVHWAAEMTRDEIEAGRAFDRHLKRPHASPAVALSPKRTPGILASLARVFAFLRRGNR